MAASAFEGRYDLTLGVALVALAPFIIVSTASLMFERQVQAELHAGKLAMQLISGFSIAGYAFGALLGGDLIQRFFQRRLFLFCQAMFLVARLLAAIAPSIVPYAIGSVAMGFATGLMLVIALPPVFQRFPAAKVPITVVWVNIGFFGAVCAGPFLGGAMAVLHGWRWFYGALAAIGFANLSLSGASIVG